MAAPAKKKQIFGTAVKRSRFSVGTSEFVGPCDPRAPYPARCGFAPSGKIRKKKSGDGSSTGDHKRR